MPVGVNGTRLYLPLTSQCHMACRFFVEPATRMCLRQILLPAFAGLVEQKRHSTCLVYPFAYVYA